MVSNFERIYSEITREAVSVASEHNFDADTLTELVMEIVDLEDQHRAKQTNVAQKIETAIVNVVRHNASGSREGEPC